MLLVGVMVGFGGVGVVFDLDKMWLLILFG